MHVSPTTGPRLETLVKIGARISINSCAHELNLCEGTDFGIEAACLRRSPELHDLTLHFILSIQTDHLLSAGEALLRRCRALQNSLQAGNETAVGNGGGERYQTAHRFRESKAHICAMAIASLTPS